MKATLKSAVRYISTACRLENAQNASMASMAALKEKEPAGFPKLPVFTYTPGQYEIALIIMLTIPITVASAEGGFSKLKLIKSFLRSTMTQERLHALAILSIENDIANNLDFKDIFTSFAKAKARKIPLGVKVLTNKNNYF